MSGAGSDGTNGDGVFNEDDGVETRMAYDKGGVPRYVGLAWVVAIVGLAIYTFAYMVPDLSRWFGP